MKRNASEVLEYDPARVKPFANQPRKRFAGITELAASIKRVGQIIPGKVIPLEGNADYDCQLLDGERRLRACAIAGVKFRAEVQTAAGSEDEQFEISLAANFGKQDHDALEIAEALARLQKTGRTLEEISDICGGKSPSWIIQHLALLKLAPDVQAMFLPAEEEVTHGERQRRLGLNVASLLANHPAELQQRIAKKIAGKSSLEARRIIMQVCHKAGVKAGANTPSSGTQFKALVTCIHHLTHRLGVFADMPGPMLTAAIASSTPAIRRRLIDQIDDLVTNLQGIAEELAKSQARPQTGPKPFVRDYARD
jgi:ParB/RepB/Spo0J family partition protein